MSEQLAAVVFGGTGAVGSQLVRQLLESSRWGKVVCIGRRPIQAEIASKGLGKLHQVQVDMDKLAEEAQLAVQEADTVFWALGTTRKDAGSASQFKKIELDWLSAAVKLAKKGGCRHFSLVTAMGASANCWACDWKPFHPLLYTKVKGLAEEMVKAEGFPRVSIFRPGLLDRGGVARPFESVFLGIVSNVKVSDVARVMILDAEACGSDNPSSEANSMALFEMKAIQEAAKQDKAPRAALRARPVAALRFGGLSR